MTIRSKIPDTGKQLASYKGSELIDRIGEEIVKEVVINVLCGTNIRSLTENLTRKRIALSNSALLMTYLNASNSIEDFQKNMPRTIGDRVTGQPIKNLLKQCSTTGKITKHQNKRFYRWELATHLSECNKLPAE